MPGSLAYLTRKLYNSVNDLYLRFTLLALAFTVQVPFFLPFTDTFPEEDVCTEHTSLLLPLNVLVLAQEANREDAVDRR